MAALSNFESVRQIKPAKFYMHLWMSSVRLLIRYTRRQTDIRSFSLTIRAIIPNFKFLRQLRILLIILWKCQFEWRKLYKASIPFQVGRYRVQNNINYINTCNILFIYFCFFCLCSDLAMIFTYIHTSRHASFPQG